MATVQIETRRRGVFGWLFTGLFWLFQVVMVLWVGRAVVVASGYPADKEGAIGAVLLLASMWVGGAIILGLMMFFTRGPKEITVIER